MPTSAQTLGRFAANLNYSDIPPEVVENAKACIIDTIGVSTFGAQFPWSIKIADYARRHSAGGKCSIIGSPGNLVQAPFAALANGVLAHAFEQDGSCEPNVGVHPGGSLVPALLAACEETGADGKNAIAALVAGLEVLLRVGAASHYCETAPESFGFHVPGLNGPFGAAATVGRVFGHNSEQIAGGLGIAGSLASGILAFTKSNQGGMVKRLHIGRSAESGYLAAELAGDGFTGPETVLEGKFGFLEAYCRGADPKLLTAGLGEDWATLRLSMKRFPCAMFAHSSVEGTRELMNAHGFTGSDVEKVTVTGAEKLVSHHNILEPNDIMQAQYSLPFCISLALYRDPDDPRSFSVDALHDPDIRSACRTLVEINARSQEGRSGYSTHLKVRLKDGRCYERENSSFKGQPSNPLTRQELRNRFMLLCESLGRSESERMLERLETLEDQPSFSLSAVAG
ncbi:MAG: MmgE/PrpD family protein [Rhizobiaceae bacterium]|nr:MmgE/PrpD family protein [Rhizobiaceae bacterium]